MRPRDNGLLETINNAFLSSINCLIASKSSSEPKKLGYWTHTAAVSSSITSFNLSKSVTVPSKSTSITSISWAFVYVLRTSIDW